MGLLVRFLFQNMKGLRALVAVAAVITVLQVSCDIGAAFRSNLFPARCRIRAMIPPVSSLS